VLKRWHLQEPLAPPPPPSLRKYAIICLSCNFKKVVCCDEMFISAWFSSEVIYCHIEGDI